MGVWRFFFFFFNDTATTEIYTLSLHDALPISWLASGWAETIIACGAVTARARSVHVGGMMGVPRMTAPGPARSEEHTSELQSRSDLVCRLLLEKKKNTAGMHTPRTYRHDDTPS